MGGARACPAWGVNRLCSRYRSAAARWKVRTVGRSRMLPSHSGSWADKAPSSASWQEPGQPLQGPQPSRARYGYRECLPNATLRHMQNTNHTQGRLPSAWPTTDDRSRATSLQTANIFPILANTSSTRPPEETPLAYQIPNWPMASTARFGRHPHRQTASQAGSVSVGGFAQRRAQQGCHRSVRRLD